MLEKKALQFEVPFFFDNFALIFDNFDLGIDFCILNDYF